MQEFFNHAKFVFKEYRKRFVEDSLLQEEFLDAIKNLLSLYDTKIYENRFIVGGVVEFIILASFNALNFNAIHIGKENERFDIQVKYKNFSIQYSVKSTFTKSDIRLINVLGESTKTKWEEPTIFVIPHCGVAYADITLIDKNSLIRQADVLVIKRKSLENLFNSQPELIIKMEIPFKEEIATTGQKIASEDIAKELLKKYKKLTL
ncbi:MAG: hypothetical protein NZ928_08025 [Endomicrobia bacterium]|nr:hypothetical protein [Endomicrobiia bacterium]